MRRLLPRRVLWLIVLVVLRAPAVGSEDASTQVAAANVLPQAASDIHSDDPSVYLTYATIQFYNGQQLLRGGKNEEAQAVFRNVEQALHSALQRSEADQDLLRRSLVRSQSSYLLGDLNSFVFSEKDKAKTFYEDALRECPQHAAAGAALGRILIPPQ